MDSRFVTLLVVAALLAPARQPEPVVERPHDGTIVTDRPNVMWGPDATAAVTLVDGAATIFAAIDHCTAECVGIHAARHGDRFEALEPLRQGVRDHFGGLAPAIALGLAIRHDHGSVYLSDDVQTEVTCLGMTSSPAFVRQPEGAARFQGTLQPGVADRATRLSIAGAGAPGVCAHARGVITINALSNSRAPVQTPLAERQRRVAPRRKSVLSG